ncbi:prepilin peptidase [Roseomonas populi]|uniref:A24 family peptidase n=1 Tax=Roseomonas populi TaxID=3121582 RepID=A0ABT1X699_9PROT|nr:A24 family peptidase [Roseomonas pecuniae]MCR0983631.1 A24 family peptidase [Roseomonas pecuniae]
MRPRSASAGWAHPVVCGAALAPLAAFLPATIWPAAALFGGLLVALAWLDWREGVVHALLVLPLAAGGLLCAALMGAGPLMAALAGASLGYLSFRLIEEGFRRLRGRDGLGRGDAWVLGAAGAWVGPGGLGPIVAGGAAIALLLVLLRDRRLAPDAALPFVPALALASWVTWVAIGGAPSWTSV